jgi:hypothetical protein
MAAKKKKKKSGKRGKGRRGSPKKGHRRRRRNPSGTFMSRLGMLAGGAVVALGTGILVTVATGKAAAGGNLSLYGIPAATFIGGVAISKAAPTIGTGIALGAFGPFALPVASHVMAGSSATGGGGLSPAMARTAAALGRSVRRMSAVQMGRSEGYRDINAVTMGAVQMGGDDDEDLDDYDD